jgi:hypothetical protein
MVHRRAKKRGPKRKAKAVKPVESSSVVESRERKTKLAALLASGVPASEAKVLAGYSAKNGNICRDVFVRETVAEMRERLRSTPGYTLEDSVGFYRGIASGSGEDTPDRLRAQTRIDSLLGLDAVKEVKVTQEKSELKVALGVLADLRVNPADAAKLLDVGGDVVEADVVDV